MISHKKGWLGVGVLAVLQLLFSFYYASEIVTLNDDMDKGRKKLDELKADGEKLAVESARMMSMTNMEHKINGLNLEPIKDEIR